jgi:uncharacterized protein
MVRILPCDGSGVGSNPIKHTIWKVKQTGFCHRLLSEWLIYLGGFRLLYFPRCKIFIKNKHMEFKTLSTKKKIDLVDYIKSYLNAYPTTELLIGCDSQNYTYNTVYATVVALYKPGNGAHILYNKENLELEKVRSIRLMNEVWKSIEVAELLRNSGLPKAKYIDIDLNPDKRYKSNEVLRSAVGLVEGMGYTVRYKSLGVMATYAADMLVK